MGNAGVLVGWLVAAGCGRIHFDAAADAANADAATVAIRIDIDGPAYTGIDHPGAWAADPGVGGICSGTQFDSPTMGIAGTNDSTLYRKQMFGTSTMSCAIPDVPAGTYRVTLLFAELRLGGAPCVCTGSCPANRIFDIALEGTTAAANLNMTSVGGGCAAIGGTGHPFDQTFTVAVTDGTLNIEETASVGDPALNAIVLVRQ